MASTGYVYLPGGARRPPGKYRLEVEWWDPETQQCYPPRILRGEGIALSEWNSLLVGTVTVP